jgi:hypothetical protein
MFDLKFYESVSKFVKYMQALMHDALPNAGYNRATIKKYFEEKVCIISILAQTSY